MNFKEYQEQAARTAHHNEDEEKALLISCCGLTGEAGEFVDYIKKIIGHRHDLDENKTKIELGDVLWYLSDLCTQLGFSLEEVAKLNIEKLKKRYPQGFSTEKSINRKPEDI